MSRLPNTLSNHPKPHIPAPFADSFLSLFSANSLDNPDFLVFFFFFVTSMKAEVDPAGFFAGGGGGCVGRLGGEEGMCEKAGWDRSVCGGWTWLSILPAASTSALRAKDLAASSAFASVACFLVFLDEGNSDSVFLSGFGLVYTAPHVVHSAGCRLFCTAPAISSFLAIFFSSFSSSVRLDNSLTRLRALSLMAFVLSSFSLSLSCPRPRLWAPPIPFLSPPQWLHHRPTVNLPLMPLDDDDDDDASENDCPSAGMEYKRRRRARWRAAWGGEIGCKRLGSERIWLIVGSKAVVDAGAGDEDRDIVFCFWKG